MHGRVSPAITPDGDNRLTNFSRTTDATDWDRVNRGLSEDTHQSKVAVEIVGHHLPGNTASCRVTKEVDLDPARAGRVSEDVSAGKNQRLTLPAVDYRAGAP
jgi:hypothetical protein